MHLETGVVTLLTASLLVLPLIMLPVAQAQTEPTVTATRLPHKHHDQVLDFTIDYSGSTTGPSACALEIDMNLDNKVKDATFVPSLTVLPAGSVWTAIISPDKGEVTFTSSGPCVDPGTILGGFEVTMAPKTPVPTLFFWELCSTSQTDAQTCDFSTSNFASGSLTA